MMDKIAIYKPSGTHVLPLPHVKNGFHTIYMKNLNVVQQVHPDRVLPTLRSVYTRQ